MELLAAIDMPMFCFQITALLGLFVLLEQDQTRPLVMVGWRCAMTTHGAPYVGIMAGAIMLPLLCASS